MRKILTLILFLSMLTMSSCGNLMDQIIEFNKKTPSDQSFGSILPPNYTQNGHGKPPENTPPHFTEEEYKIAVFENGYPDGFFARNDRGNGSPFNCSFSNTNAVVEGGLLRMSITEGRDNFVGAEFRTQKKYSYGFYSVSMRPAKCSGVISSFFIYTNWPWDEIDIEFLGNDTTKIQFNYFTNGVGGHEFVYDLGFDASEEFHEYAFNWQEDSITWYVDGIAVYRATSDIPSHSGNIMMNIWNVADSHANWAGRFDDSTLPVSAEYQWIGYQSAGACTLDK